MTEIEIEVEGPEGESNALLQELLQATDKHGFELETDPAADVSTADGDTIVVSVQTALQVAALVYTVAAFRENREKAAPGEGRRFRLRRAGKSVEITGADRSVIDRAEGLLDHDEDPGPERPDDR